jgi:hypothetical protein
MDRCGAPTSDFEHGANREGGGGKTEREAGEPIPLLTLSRDDTGRRSTAGGDERPEAALWKTGGSGDGDAR